MLDKVCGCEAVLDQNRVEARNGSDLEIVKAALGNTGQQ
jgi:hypothetical protein